MHGRCVLRGLLLGQCLASWSSPELLAQKGGEQEVSVHVVTGAEADRMDFTSKNFCYRTLPFSELVKRAAYGCRPPDGGRPPDAAEQTLGGANAAQPPAAPAVDAAQLSPAVATAPGAHAPDGGGAPAAGAGAPVGEAEAGDAEGQGTPREQRGVGWLASLPSLVASVAKSGRGSGASPVPSGGGAAPSPVAEEGLGGEAEPSCAPAGGGAAAQRSADADGGGQTGAPGAEGAADPDAEAAVVMAHREAAAAAAARRQAAAEARAAEEEEARRRAYFLSPDEKYYMRALSRRAAAPPLSEHPPKTKGSARALRAANSPRGAPLARRRRRTVGAHAPRGIAQLGPAHGAGGLAAGLPAARGGLYPPGAARPRRLFLLGPPHRVARCVPAPRFHHRFPRRIRERR